MNIFGLGLVAGGSQAYLNKKAAEAEEASKEKDHERGLETLREQFNLQVQADQARALLDYGLQKDIATFQAGIEKDVFKYKSGIELDMDKTLAKLNYDLDAQLVGVQSAHQLAATTFSSKLNHDLQMARDLKLHDLEKNLLKYQTGLQEGTLGLQHSYSMAIRAYEDQLARAQTKDERSYIEGRLTELNRQAKQAARLGQPFVSSAGYQIYGWPDATTSGNSRLGGSARPNVLEGVDDSEVIFPYQDRFGNLTYVPGVDVDVRKKEGERIKQRFVNVLDAVGHELWWHIENDTDVLQSLQRELVTNINTAEFRNTLQVEKDDKGRVVIQNPVNALQLKALITKNGMPDEASQRWFAENIVRPAVGISAQAIKQSLGLPPEVELGYDSTTDTFTAPPQSEWGWATQFTFNGTGKASLKPEIKEQALSVAQISNRPVAQVLASVSMFADPAKALKDIADSRESLRAMLEIDEETGEVYPTPAFNSAMARRIKNAGLTPEQGIQYMRNFVNDEPYRHNDTIEIVGGTSKAVFNKRMKDVYGIDRVEARAKQAAARASNKIIDEMISISNATQGAVKAGKIGDIRLGAAGLAELANDFRGFVSALETGAFTLEDGSNLFSASEADIERLNGIEAELTRLSQSGDMITINELQSVFNMLGESLAYQQAAVAQGGAQGRDISDRDVQAWRKKLGLEGLLVFTPGVIANLEHLKNENTQIEAIYGGFANAKNDTQFKAAFLYNEAVGVAPRDYTTYGRGAPNTYGEARINESMLGDTVTTIINGQEMTFSME